MLGSQPWIYWMYSGVKEPSLCLNVNVLIFEKHVSLEMLHYNPSEVFLMKHKKTPKKQNDMVRLWKLQDKNLSFYWN